MTKFEAALIGDEVVHDGATPCGTIGPNPSVPPTVLIENQPVAVSGCVVVCSGATSGGPVHPPAPATVVASNTSVQVGKQAVALRSPSPDVTTCGAMLGNPSVPKKPSSVKIGVYVPLPPDP